MSALLFLFNLKPNLLNLKGWSLILLYVCLTPAPSQQWMQSWATQGRRGNSKQHSIMVTSPGFQATAVWPPFVSGLWTGEGVVFIHKLSGHMKCLVTHVKDLDTSSTTHRTKNVSSN